MSHTRKEKAVFYLKNKIHRKSAWSHLVKGGHKQTICSSILGIEVHR